MRVCSVVGTRPQLVKLAALVPALADAGHEHVIVHTGQHYDDAMSGELFDDLKIPDPDINLGVRRVGHGQQTAAMLAALEVELLRLWPDRVLVYGDTNSTLAAVLAAAKLGRVVGHVEAGARSFNRAMPEEMNRVTADHLSDLLFAPTKTAMRNLGREGLAERAVLVGDVMADLLPSPRNLPRPEWLPAGPYLVATLHRPSNVDDPMRLAAVARALSKLPLPVVLPAHPRLLARRRDFGVALGGKLRPRDPVPYTQMVAAVAHSAGVVTDSGGLQKEAYLLGVRCTTLRAETEWPETLDGGWNVLVADPLELPLAVTRAVTGRRHRRVFGDGDAAARIVQALA